ncbi:MAG: hypothetical protein O2954_17750, partial [bacterium]|nr:hypothetical protein [bacterium]
IPFIIELGMHYNYLGLDELQREKPPDAREETDGLAQLKWNDEHPDQELFTNWKPFNHPQLGPIEIGGWNYILWSNPPPDEMEAVCQRSTEFVLHHAAHRPRIEISNTTVTPLSDGLYKLTTEIRNTGTLSTSVTRQGQDTHPHTKPTVSLNSPENLEIIIGAQSLEIDHLPARTGRVDLEWVIRTSSPELTLEITSERGIYTRRTIPTSGN